MKNKIENTPCEVCGGETTLRFVPSSGMDIHPVGLFKDCERCGYSQKIKALNEKE